MIHIRRQQQPVINVQALDIARITPRFAVAREQVFDPIHLCDATEGLDTLDVLFEQALTPARHDDCMPRGFGNSPVGDHLLRSDESRVGKGVGSPCRYWGSGYDEN